VAIFMVNLLPSMHRIQTARVAIFLDRKISAKKFAALDKVG